MKLTRIAQFGAITAVAALTLVGCAANESGSATDASSDASSSSADSLTGTLNGGGATSQQVAVQTWTAEFQKANATVTVNYDPQGSGTGRESFASGAFNFAGSDRAFKTDELTSLTFEGCVEGSSLVEIPAYISPIAIAFNLGADIKTLDLTPEVLAGIFAGTITTWNDPAIAATNAGVTLPDTKITPVHRSDKSGTTGNFTDYLTAAGGGAWSAGSVEEWPKEITTGEAAQGTSGVVEAIKAGVGTIGYADSSQAADLASVNIKVGDEFVGHSAEGAALAADASPLEEGRADTDLAIKIDRSTTAAGAYPVVLISYLIGCAEYKDAAVGTLVKGFFNTAISAAGQDAAAASAGSAPISDDLRAKAQTAVDAIK